VRTELAAARSAAWLISSAAAYRYFDLKNSGRGL
jgi:hypothetical protein